MRRRRLLAALATGGLGAAAGCGYAYGGGDLREEGSVYAGGFGTTRWALAEDRIVVANSGRIVDHDRGGFYDGTSVTVADLDGNDLWRYTHWTHSTAVAGADPAYILDERSQVVAIDGERPYEELTAVERRTADAEERWRAAVEGAAPPLVCDDDGAYVAVEDGVAAVRDGSEAWRTDLSGPAESLLVAGDTVIATTETAVVALAPSGRERWRRDESDTATPPRIASSGDRVAIYDGTDVTVVEAATGERSWSEDTGGRATTLAAANGRLFLRSRGELRAFDATTGDTAWETGVPAGLEPPFVSAPEGVYGVDGRCRAVALDGEGIRWTREVDVGSCDLVGGWLDGERVAFLFESGAIRWLQRTDQDPGLL